MEMYHFSDDLILGHIFIPLSPILQQSIHVISITTVYTNSKVFPAIDLIRPTLAYNFR